MNSKNKTNLVPKLRFHGFNESWSIEPISKVLLEHKLKNVNGRDVFSVSMESGIVNQIEHLGRSYAAADTSHYTVARRFDVVYTKSPLKAFPFGIVKQSKYDGEIALSPLYGVFTPVNPHVGLMIEAYFESPNRSISFRSPLCQKGAKNTLQITNDTFLSGHLPLPKEPAEQEKIANCLSSLDELIAAQGCKVEALKTHKKGLMQQIFPREGETQPRLRFPEFQNAGEWKVEVLGQLMTIKGRIGYRGYTVEDIVEAGEGAISLSPSNISAAGTLIFEKATYISWAKFYESPEIILEKNFTVLVKTGSTYGKVAFIKDLPHECTVNPQIVVLKPTSINPYFLYLLISGEPIQSRIEATVVGGAIPTLSQENVSKFVVSVPSGAEQQRIADCLTSLDDLITANIQDLETLKTHKEGMMQQLFPRLDEGRK